MNSQGHPNDDRDAHLRAALRHAPDAALGAPPAVSALILSEARARVRPAPRPLWAPLMALWDGLARPAVAAGFASLMVATAVGMLWWGKPMDDALRTPEAEAPVARPDTAGAPASAAVAATPPSPRVRESTAEARRASAADKAESKALRKGVASAETERSSASTTDSAAPPQAQEALASKPAVAPAPAPAPAPAREPSPVTPSAPAAAPASPATQATGNSSSKAQADTAQTGAAEAPAPIAMAPTMTRSMKPGPRVEGAAADSAPSPMAEAARVAPPNLRAQLLREPGRWSWQQPGRGAPQPLHGAVQSVVTSLARLAWQDEVGAAPAAAGHELILLRDDGVQHRFVLIGRTVWWIQADGGSRLLTKKAEVSETTAEALENEFDALH